MMGCSSSWLSHGKSLRLFCWATCLSHCFVDTPFATGAGLGLVMLRLDEGFGTGQIGDRRLRTRLFKELDRLPGGGDAQRRSRFWVACAWSRRRVRGRSRPCLRESASR